MKTQCRERNLRIIELSKYESANDLVPWSSKKAKITYSGIEREK
jgi:hypothetical protein